MVRVQKLTVGEVYRNRNGWDYLCLENAGPGVAVLERVSDGWTLLAHGICVYEDGSIEWDWSTWGHWPDGRPRRRRSTMFELPEYFGKFLSGLSLGLGIASLIFSFLRRK